MHARREEHETFTIESVIIHARTACEVAYAMAEALKYTIRASRVAEIKLRGDGTTPSKASVHHHVETPNGWLNCRDYVRTGVTT